MILNAKTLKRKMFGVNNFHASKEAQWSNAVVLWSAFYLMGENNFRADMWYLLSKIEPNLYLKTKGTFQNKMKVVALPCALK